MEQHLWSPLNVSEDLGRGGINHWKCHLMSAELVYETSVTIYHWKITYLIKMSVHMKKIEISLNSLTVPKNILRD